jgi:RHS repeat-associated protein
VVQLNGDRFVSATFTKTPNHIATTYYHTDVIGSVRAITDETGAVVSRHDYLPFGEDTQPLTGDPMRFAGKELDPETALQNFEARYYRNTWGRFTQVDPVSGSLSDTQSWNRYAYARNNPMRFVDPTGMDTTCVESDRSACVVGHSPVVLTTSSGQQLTVPDLSSQLGVNECAGVNEDGVIYTVYHQCDDGTNGFGGGTSSEAQPSSEAQKSDAPQSPVLIVGAVALGTLEAPAEAVAAVVVAAYEIVAHWDDVVHSFDKALTWANHVLQARKPDLEEIDYILDQEGITDPKTRRRIHDEITGQGYSREEIREIARSLKAGRKPWAR